MVASTKHAFLNLALTLATDTQAAANIILLALGCKLQRALHACKESRLLFCTEFLSSLPYRQQGQPFTTVQSIKALKGTAQCCI